MSSVLSSVALAKGDALRRGTLAREGNVANVEVLPMTLLPIANERKTAMKKTMMAAMVAALVCVAVVLGIYPADRTVWCVEMVWAVGLWAVQLLMTSRFFSSSPMVV